ncbi:MAG: CpXC domain-containing protein [Anaerolineae bacterium]
MAFPPMPTTMTCPQCGANFVVEVHTIIDVGQDPDLKDAFLRSRLNFARCPQCDFAGLISIPIIYHDPEHELLITYVPPELDINGDEREKLVGQLVNAVMQAVPQEQRKGYFLQPRTALTYEGLLDAVYEAEGISKETLEQQRKARRLINSLLGSLEDDQALDALVEEHREELDYSFFLLLSSLIDAAREDDTFGLDADELQQLRRALLDRVETPTPPTAPEDATVDDLIQLLETAEDDRAFESAVMLNRERLDYAFFEALTQRIEAAQTDGDNDRAGQLTDLRQRILDIMDRQRQAIQELEDEAHLLVMELLDAEDMAAAVREHKDDLNDIVLTTALRLHQAAKRRGDEKRAKRLDELVSAILVTMEESLPPKQRFINRLLRTETPDESNDMLEANRGLLDDELVEVIEAYAEELAENESELAHEMLEHVQRILKQIEAKRTIQRG